MSHKQLAFDVAYAQLRSQKEDLRNARNQAGMAATMTSLIATMFASIVETDDIVGRENFSFLSINLEFWLVLLTFTMSLYYAAMVGLSQKTCHFELVPHWILRRETGMYSIEETKAQLARDCDNYFDQNEEVITEARVCLWRSIVLGCAQIPAWLLNLV